MMKKPSIYNIMFSSVSDLNNFKSIIKMHVLTCHGIYETTSKNIFNETQRTKIMWISSICINNAWMM